MIAPAPLRQDPWLLSDWVEFKAICSQNARFSFNELSRLYDENQDAESSDISRGDAENEVLLDAVISEINVRIKSLSNTYPFTLSHDGHHLIFKLDDTVKAGQFAYLYCLIFSHLIRDEVIEENVTANNHDRDLMQICSTLAAANLCHNAVSFGYPRPDGSNMYNALQTTYTKIGEGRLRAVQDIADILPKANYQKDGGIDIIAWDSTNDDAPGRSYLLGQVASGENWEHKSVVEAIKPFHNIWFSQIPSSTPRPAIFIPFCIEANCHEERKKYMSTYSYRYGEVYYRYRIPIEAQKGYENAQNHDDRHIERCNNLNDVY